MAAPPDPATLSAAQRARRERIVAAAFELLHRSEYEAIQMRDVAEQAGVALGTVYRYFSSKEHLFAVVLVRWSEALRSQVEASIPAPGEASGADGDTADLAARVVVVYLRAIGVFRRRPQFMRALIVVENTHDPHARAAYREFADVSHAAFSRPLDPLGPEQAEAVTLTLLAVLNGVLRPWARGELSIHEARRRMATAVELVFSPPPQPASGAR